MPVNSLVHSYGIVGDCLEDSSGVKRSHEPDEESPCCVVERHHCAILASIGSSVNVLTILWADYSPIIFRRSLSAPVSVNKCWRGRLQIAILIHITCRAIRLFILNRFISTPTSGQCPERLSVSSREIGIIDSSRFSGGGE